MMVLAAMTVLLGGGLFARDRMPRDWDCPGWGEWGRGPGVNRERRRDLPEPEKTTVTGALGLSHGIIVIEGEGRRYYVPALRRYIGFIDGLKEGAQVSAEGYSFRPWAGAGPEALKGAADTGSAGNAENRTEGFLRVTRLTVNGKDYDLSPLSGPFGEPFRGSCRSSRRR
jgi:hypothetical protein